MLEPLEKAYLRTYLQQTSLQPWRGGGQGDAGTVLYPHSADEASSTQRGKVTSPKSLDPKLSLLDFRAPPSLLQQYQRSMTGASGHEPRPGHIHNFGSSGFGSSPARGWRGHDLEDRLAEQKPAVEMQNHE